LAVAQLGNRPDEVRAADEVRVKRVGRDVGVVVAADDFARHALAGRRPARIHALALDQAGGGADGDVARAVAVVVPSVALLAGRLYRPEAARRDDRRQVLARTGHALLRVGIDHSGRLHARADAEATGAASWAAHAVGVVEAMRGAERRALHPRVA